MRDPRTTLVVQVRRECTSAIRVFEDRLLFKTQDRECRVAAQAGDVSCYGELFSRAARGARLAANASVVTNREVARRGLHGGCADKFRTAVTDIRDLRRMGRASRIAGQALHRHDLARLRVAALEDDAAFKRLLDSPDDHTRLSACPHERS